MFDRSDHVRVKNGTDKAIKGRWNGTDYVWKPHAHLDVPLVVARHIFGFGGDEKAKNDALARLGWTRTTDDLEAAYERYNLLTFSDCPALVEAGEGIGNVRPLVNAGGDSGRGESNLASPDEPAEADGETL